MDLDLDYDFHRTSSAPGRLNKEPARAAIGCWIRLLYARPRLSPFIASFPFHLSLSLSIRYLEFHTINQEASVPVTQLPKYDNQSLLLRRSCFLALVRPVTQLWCFDHENRQQWSLEQQRSKVIQLA